MKINMYVQKKEGEGGVCTECPTKGFRFHSASSGEQSRYSSRNVTQLELNPAFYL